MMIIFDSCVNAGASFVRAERWEKERRSWKKIIPVLFITQFGD